jgi:hypothetical protein
MGMAQHMKSMYLDLEDRADREKLSNPVFFLSQYDDHLVILDEMHRIPELFQSLRGLIDKGRRSGRGKGRFLLLGSAAIGLLRQSSESLAGRIGYVDLGPFDILEVGDRDAKAISLWCRGGYPDSYLATEDEESLLSAAPRGHMRASFAPQRTLRSTCFSSCQAERSGRSRLSLGLRPNAKGAFTTREKMFVPIVHSSCIRGRNATLFLRELAEDLAGLAERKNSGRH